MDAKVNDLSSILGQLHGLVPDDRRADVAELRRRLDEDRFRVLVVGEAKRGKSTFVNAMLGRCVLPMGVTPLTAVATTVEYGEPECVRVDYDDGRHEDCALDRLGDFVTEDGNPENWRGVAKATVRLTAPILRQGLELVDTPGAGSVFAHNSREAEGALDTMDAAVFVLTTDPPVSAGERDLLRRVVDRSVATFFVLNKADYLSLDELRTVHDFTVQTLSAAVGHPVSV